ncbi:hypothetical protein SK128_015543 [Halocaridina rubra]|uniref:Uncharacterized protein n=1 Tax=Halocaridina rubra TaxID=373956 RepID=A0AAN8XDD9_HALRR
MAIIVYYLSINKKRFNERPSKFSNLGRPEQCKNLFTIEKGAPDDVWKPDKYEALSRQLPSLLPEKIDAIYNYSTVIYPGTRLQRMNYTIPYIPCKIRPYTAEDVGQCSVKRIASGSSTWIALVGDSTVRFKLHEFLNFLPPDLTYSFFLGDREVSRQEFYDAVIFHKNRPPTFDIIGKLSTSGRGNLPLQRLNTSMEDRIRMQTTSRANVISNKTDQSYVANSRTKYELNWSNDPLNGTSFNGNDSVDNDFYQNNKINLVNNGQREGKDKQASNTNNVEEEEPEEKIEFNYTDEDLLETQVPRGSYQFRLSLIWAPAGSRRSHPASMGGPKVKKIQEWLDTGMIPDVIVVGKYSTLE